MNRRLALLLILAAGGARAASWTAFRHDSERSGFTGEQADAPLLLRWRHVISPPGQSVQPSLSSPAVGYGKVFVGGRNRSLVALDAFSGQLLWTYVAGGWIDASPALADGLVFLASRDGALQAVNAQTGARAWLYSTGSDDVGSPVVVNGTLYAVTGYPNHQLLALNDKTGSLVGSASLPGNSSSSPTVDPALGLVMVGSHDGSVSAFHLPTLTPAWSKSTVGGNYHATLADSGGSIVGLPGNDDRAIHAWTPSGTAAWSSSSLCANPIFVGSPAIAGNLVVATAGCANGGTGVHQLYAVSLSNGGPIWGPVSIGAKGPANGFASSPAVANGLVYVGGSDGNLYCVTLSSGGLVGTYNLGSDVVSSPAVANGWVYVATMSGQLFAFQASAVTAIASPDPNLSPTVQGVVPIQGYVLSPGTVTYKVEVGSGTNPSSWTTLATSTNQANGSLLASWNTLSLPPGPFTVRLTTLSSSTVVAQSTAGYTVTQSSQVAVSASVGGIVSLADGTELDIPANALVANDTVTMQLVLSGQPTNGIPGSALPLPAPVVREIDLASGPHPVFNTPVTLKIPYLTSNLPSGGVEANLRIYYYDDIKNVWSMVNTSVVHSNEQRVWATMNHLTTFQVMDYLAGQGPLIQALYTYPNPARGSSLNFKFLLGDNANVQVTVYSVSGNPVALLKQNGYPAGIASTLTWDISHKASGVYMYVFQATSATTTQKEKQFLSIIH